MGILPWLIIGGLGLYAWNKSRSTGSTTASNGTTVDLPGLYVPTTITPLTSDDVVVARQVIGASGPYSDWASYSAADRLNLLNRILVSWGEMGRSDRIPDLRTAISLG